MEQRVDSLDRKYEPVDNLKLISTVLFWLNATLSIIIFFVDGVEVLKNTLTIIFIVTTILYFIEDNFLRIFLIPSVEAKRRKHLLTNSLGTRLESETTNLYYNNDLDPSIIRLGANVLENSLFAKRVTTEMIKGETISVIIYVITWLVCLSIRTTELEFISIVSQTLFASTIIPSWVRLIILRAQNGIIFDELYQLFLLRKDTSQRKLIPLIIDVFVKYESSKAYSGVKQSSKIFHKINPEVTREWEDIKRTLDL